MDKIVSAALHGREIVKKLLIYARQVPTKKSPLSLNEVVEEGLYFLEARARELGVAYFVGRAAAPDRHPAALPGAKEITIKLLFAEKTRHLIGAQLSGGNSVGELVNMLSVLIQHRTADIEIVGLQMGTHPRLTSSAVRNTVVGARGRGKAALRLGG